MSRKTVKIVNLIIRTNDMLKNSTTSPDERMAVCIFLEDILHENGVYAGYRYFDFEEVPEGHLPGILVDDAGNRKFDRNRCDETRREYLIHSSLFW